MVQQVRAQAWPAWPRPKPQKPPKGGALNAEHGQSGSTLTRWQRTLRVRSKLARIATELADLADLPAVPPQTLAAWRAALDTDAALMHDITALDSADAIEAAEIAAMKVDDGLLAESAAVDALRERLGVVRKAIDDLPPPVAR